MTGGIRWKMEMCCCRIYDNFYSRGNIDPNATGSVWGADDEYLYDAYEKEMKEIVNRHIEMVYTVIPAGRGRELLLDLVNELLSECYAFFPVMWLYI